jgi:hypothetical protein
MEDTMDSPLVQIAVHCYAGVTGATLISTIAEVIRAMKIRDIIASIVIPPDDALLSRVRCKLITNAITEKADVLIWLDHDIQFDAGDLAGLALRAIEKKGVVGGLYPKREMHGGMPWRPLGDTPHVLIGDDALHPAIYVGGGFVAMHVPSMARAMDVLASSDDPNLKVHRCCAGPGQPDFWDICRPISVRRDDGRHDYLSEDWAFFHRMLAAGVGIWAWTRPWLTHYGQYGFTPIDSQPKES